MRLSRFTQSQIRAAASPGGQLDHIPGLNPRKQKLTSAPGTNPKRQHMGMSQHTAPYKHQSSLFGKAGISTAMGMEGPEEGLPP